MIDRNLQLASMSLGYATARAAVILNPMPSISSPPTSPDTSSSALLSDVAPSSYLDGTNLSQTDSSSLSGPDGTQRRPSVQFNTAGSEARLRERVQASTKDRLRTLRRIPSPPPPSSYNRGVSFDTFDNRDAPDFSLTLNYKHKDYQNTWRSRTFLCGADQNDYSDFALEWLIDELVDDGDEIVCLRVVEKDSKIASDTGAEGRRYRKEAENLFEQVIAKNSHDEKAISLVMELAVGKVQDIIQRMIQIYEPAALIVGTRGRSLGGMQGLLPGSVSKYCLQQSPIPVIVVRPSQKREKKKQKRLADPSRRSYNQIMRLSQGKGDHLFDTTSASSSTSRLPEPEEAAAVAEAIGPPPSSITDLHEEHALKRSSGDYISSQASTGGDTESIGQRSTTTMPNPEISSPNLSSAILQGTGLPEAGGMPVGEVGGDDEDYMDDSSRITPMSTMTSEHSFASDPMDELTPVPQINVLHSPMSEYKPETTITIKIPKPSSKQDPHDGAGDGNPTKVENTE
ncbi:universal stress protein family domain-containing protein [Coccidioides immitis RS]|uniref:Universal stress protein family domain-containing protein n=1 Tax=Coccidioides immitis (strain RS) TaxID=246410 RepID=A0A0E1RV67_COCIM|nr:universal stress protein family domain-containing protein [Coccidioides immitis RS]EAS29131.1 universal stress protein family domain-containing protein [Coccidioides immitis RS]